MKSGELCRGEVVSVRMAKTVSEKAVAEGSGPKTSVGTCLVGALDRPDVEVIKVPEGSTG